MANNISTFTFLFALTVLTSLVTSGPVYGQQSSQAELEADFTEVKWDVMAGAQTYAVTIAKDRAMTQIVTRAEVPSSKTNYEAKNLAAATYYVVVKGLNTNKEVVGITAPLPLVVGATFTVTGKRFGLPPPHLFEPQPESLLAPEKKIRFVWSRVPEAVRYRFRILKERQDNGEYQLLWQTETDRNYIELTDAPPTSYRYFQEGRYRWQVACLTGPKGDQAFDGDDAESHFVVTKDVLLEKLNDDGELMVTAGGGIFWYSGTSGITSHDTSVRGTGKRLGLDIRQWFSTHTGLFISGSLTAFESPYIDGVLKSISMELMRRTQISNTAAGWSINDGWSAMAGLGAGLRQDLQVDDIFTKSFPVSIGLRWRAGLIKRMTERLSSEIFLSGLVPLMTYRGGGNNDPIDATIVQPLSVDAQVQLAYALNTTTKLRFGFLAYNYRSQYLQAVGQTTNNAQGLFGNIALSFLF